MFAVRLWWLAPIALMLAPRMPDRSPPVPIAHERQVGAGAANAPLSLDLNLPSFRLDVYEANRLTRSIPVAVGMPRYETPRGEFSIIRIEWNPWWIPPDSPWAAHEHRTPPGPDNPMGKVKLYFRPMYFLHGTPLESSIGGAASHGCVRLAGADAVALAKLVHRYATPRLDSATLRRIIDDSTTTRSIDLDVDVPLTIRYDLVELRGGRVSVYRDIYHLATRPLRAEVYAALDGAGVDTTRLDALRVARLVSRARSRGASADLDSLLVPR